MASSGSVNFSVSRNDIITAVLQDLGVMKGVDTTSSASFTDNSTAVALRLNMFVKQQSGNADFSSGIKMWSRKRAYLFLSKDNAVYTLGPTTTQTGTTNKWASSYVRTTIASSEAAGQTTISLTSATGIADTDRIGIVLDDGTIHWSVVSGAPAGNDVVISDSLASAAAAGNTVFAYDVDNQGRRPLSILTGSLRDTNGIDVPFDPSMLLHEYEAIADKGANGSPSRGYYEATLTDGTLYLDIETDDVSKVIRLVYLSPIEDFDASTDTPDYDQNWYLPLVLGTEYLCAPMFGRHEQMEIIRAMRDEALAVAKNSIPETSLVYFQCGVSG